jgi:hypothetical protein
LGRPSRWEGDCGAWGRRCGRPGRNDLTCKSTLSRRSASDVPGALKTFPRCRGFGRAGRGALRPRHHVTVQNATALGAEWARSSGRFAQPVMGTHLARKEPKRKTASSLKAVRAGAGSELRPRGKRRPRGRAPTRRSGSRSRFGDVGRHVVRTMVALPTHVRALERLGVAPRETCHSARRTPRLATLRALRISASLVAQDYIIDLVKETVDLRSAWTCYRC